MHAHEASDAMGVKQVDHHARHGMLVFSLPHIGDGQVCEAFISYLLLL